ncbi:glycerol dehydrogenase [Siculibacillus lacustris]|uniref:Glycerol dehydrogenase n=1 Tax=Siculibacillus lacustris TaxID=1549641 RepID=A0A4Q9VJ63_9HYPH|nr:glycerol dehydrogenase [Siculibacillus lacustris]TBW35340.1 glycerol dehydrogenase [Siculibacillus lacustris]
MISTSIFPSRYVQGADAFATLASETARLGSRALAIVSPTAHTNAAVAAALAANAEVAFDVEIFGRECCRLEIDRLSAVAKRTGAQVIVGIGGGKALDTAKAVAHDRGLPVVIAPTLASTDAPCSALSVIYTPDGAFESYLVLPRNPDVVLVDSAVIAQAPVRFLVSGMGDALATWFEAEDCFKSGATNMTGRVGSMTVHALARLCWDTLRADGVAAKAKAAEGLVDAAVERIIEANTLLSGIGFESGGLSGAHAIHNGLTVLAPTHHYWHGEKVAIGTQALMFLTGRPNAVITEVYRFCVAVGLPITLADIGLDSPSDADLMKVAELACAAGETIHNVPSDTTPAQVFAALKAADAYGRRFALVPA